MTARNTFDQALAAFLEEGPTMAPGDLLATVQDRLPERGAARSRGATWRLPALLQVSRTVVVVAAVAIVGVGGIWLFNGGGAVPAGPGATSTAAPSPTGSAQATDAQPTGGPNETPAAPVCDPSNLVVRITAWSGAAGHRIADVVLTNAGPVACELPTLERVQLIDGSGATLIDGGAIAGSDTVTIDPGAVLTTLVDDANYCGPTPAAPVTVAFVLPGDAGRIVAVPVSATDVEGVPPCNGPAGSLGSIEMHPWAP
jgi:hypothetical protein